MVVRHTAQGKQLVPAGSIEPGMCLYLANGEEELTEVTGVTTMDPVSAKGLANILTGPETIIVNGLYGSHLTASSSERPARFMLWKVNAVAGAKGARCVYRAMEWALENIPKLDSLAMI